MFPVNSARINVLWKITRRRFCTRRTESENSFPLFVHWETQTESPTSLSSTKHVVHSCQNIHCILNRYEPSIAIFVTIWYSYDTWNIISIPTHIIPKHLWMRIWCRMQRQLQLCYVLSHNQNIKIIQLTQSLTHCK